MQNLYVFVKARVLHLATHLFQSRPLMLLTLFVVLSMQQSFGQAMVENAMNSIKSWIVIILNVAFLIGIAIGIFKAAMKFFTGAPDKVEFMIGIVIAIALFGGFQFIVDDLAAFLGGDILLDDTN
ncbi:flagellar biosynthesis protein FliQ [Catalinimonas alkaloidigena]|jgi:hypothetical protein|uniref:hypothetical protein n=1 Tax=Catalinimonas TaxID=1522128 RepID=UPI0024051C06|nr:hypothetical protein [Catalinimonas alkaloidigena]MDF9799100.1 flagellar biosynthesis protein FliQ [Catalinimonas alkaloidigena]